MTAPARTGPARLSLMTERVVVFDLGMVLCSPNRLFEGLGDLLGTGPDAIEKAFWGDHRHSYDEGIDDVEFWRQAYPLVEGAREVDLEQLVPELVAIDIAGWKTPRPGSRRIMERLKEEGVETAVLSNAPRSFADAAPTFDWYDLIGTWFFSGQLKVAKPDPGIYQKVEEGLGRTGDQLWFVDDKQVNIDAALARGWNAHLWVDDADTEAWLVREGFLPEA